MSDQNTPNDQEKNVFQVDESLLSAEERDRINSGEPVYFMPAQRAAFDRKRLEMMGLAHVPALIQLLKSKYPQLFTAKRRILELGAGAADYSRELLRRSPLWTSVAIEADEDSVKNGQKLAKNAGVDMRLQYLHQYIDEDTDFTQHGKFDLILVVAFATHKPKKKLFKNLIKQLNPGGIIVFVDLWSSEDIIHAVDHPGFQRLETGLRDLVRHEKVGGDLDVADKVSIPTMLEEGLRVRVHENRFAIGGKNFNERFTTDYTMMGLTGAVYGMAAYLGYDLEEMLEVVKQTHQDLLSPTGPSGVIRMKVAVGEKV